MLLKLSGRQFFSNFEHSKLIGVVLRADFRPKPCPKWKRFRFVHIDWGINPAGVGWWARQHHGLLKLSGRQFFSNFENSKLIGVVLRADFRPKPCPKRKRFRFVHNDWGINPAGVGWWTRQHHGLLKLSGRQFFSNFENSKLIGVVLRADFRPKPGPKRKLATSRGYSSQTGGLREKSFQILNHLSWVNNLYI